VQSNFTFQGTDVPIDNYQILILRVLLSRELFVFRLDILVPFGLLFIIRTAVNPHSHKYELANCIIAILCFFFILCDYIAQSPNINLYILIGNFNFKEVSLQTQLNKS